MASEMSLPGFGIAMIFAFLHWCGMSFSVRQRMRKCESHFNVDGPEFFRNSGNTLSWPAALCFLGSLLLQIARLL